MLAGYFISNVINIKGSAVAERNLFYCLWLYPSLALYDFLGQNFPSPLKFDSRVRIHHGFLWDESGGRWVAVAGCWSRSNLYSDITFPPLTPIMRGKHTSIKENTQTASCAPVPHQRPGWLHLIWSSINITIKLQSARNLHKHSDGP